MNLNPFNRKKRKTNKFAVNRPSVARSVKDRKKETQGGLLKRAHGKPNINLIIWVGLILVGGLLMNYSASAILAYGEHGDSFYYFKRQLLFIILGCIVGYIAYIVPIKVYRKSSTVILIAGIVLLLYMLPEALKNTIGIGWEMPLVETLNGATRWINIGLFGLQPSEVVKVGFVIYLAAWLTRKIDKPQKGQSEFHHHFIYTMLPFILILGLISVLILVQNDFDGTVVIALTAFIIYYVSGDDRLHNLGSMLLLGFSSLIGVFALLGAGYRRTRISSFFHLFFTGKPSDATDADFQVWNGLVGLGNGWFFGRGYGESRIKQGFLQEAAYTDSILIVIGEEFGLFGVILIVIAFLYLGSIGFQIAQKTEDKFEKLLALGLTSWIVVQAFLNIGANLAVIPFGGMPLPFFTYGGSGIIVALASIGILLNISKKQGIKVEPGSARVQVIGRAVSK